MAKKVKEPIKPEESFEEALEVAVEQADDGLPTDSALERAMELIGILHARVKRLEDAKGWHDVDECLPFGGTY